MNASVMRLLGVAVCAIALAGCGGGPPAPAGVYEADIGGGEKLSLHFLGDSTVKISNHDGGYEDSYESTFALVGNTVVVKIPAAERGRGDPENFTLARNGDALELTADSATIRFVKR